MTKQQSRIGLAISSIEHCPQWTTFPRLFVLVVVMGSIFGGSREALAVTPTFTYTPTATYTPTYTARGTSTATFTPTPAVYDMNRRVHVGTQLAWKPKGNGGILWGTCDLVSQPSHGSATCSTNSSGKWEPGSYMSDAGYSGADSFEYRVKSSSGVFSNVAKVNVEVSSPCLGAKCYSLKRRDGSIEFETGDLFASEASVNDMGEVALLAKAGVVNNPYLTYFSSASTNGFMVVNDLLRAKFGSMLWSLGNFRLNNTSKISGCFEYGYDSPFNGCYVIDLYTGDISDKAPSPSHIVHASVITDKDQVLISPYSQGNFFIGLVWDPISNQSSDLPLIRPSWACPGAWSVDMNDGGLVLGQIHEQVYTPYSFCAPRSFAFNPFNGELKVMSLGQDENSYLPVAINNQGLVLIRKGPYTEERDAEIWDVNSGVTTGLGFLSDASYIDPGDSIPFVRLKTPFTRPVGLSDGGTVVGMSSSGFELLSPFSYNFPITNYPFSIYPRNSEAFVWDGVDGMTPLFHRLDATAAGWEVIPMAVSKNGLIVGLGRHASIGYSELVVLEPVSRPNICEALYPSASFSLVGRQGTLSITFTGNITSHTNKEVKVCPGTSLEYQTQSTRGPVICRIKNNITRGSGTLRIKDHLKCTDKPAGQDKIHFKVKSGVK